MSDAYRDRIRNNLNDVLLRRGMKPNDVVARYMGGPKAGKLVSKRSFRNLCDSTDASSPSVDLLFAIAAALNVEAHQLLAPRLDASGLSDIEKAIAEEVERRLAARSQISKQVDSWARDERARSATPAPRNEDR